MKEIILNNGMIATIDDNMVDRIKYFDWTYRKINTKYSFCEYAECSIPRNGGKAHRVFLHQMVMGTPPTQGLEIDHIDGNGLNNQLTNLRFCTSGQNKMNRRKRVNTEIKYKGVRHAKYKDSTYIYAQISVNHKTIYIGNYKTYIDAAIAYNEAAIKYHGEFANLNII